ncbi:conserved Plasmodium protein, unknown function [Plasmodium yoelii]|nr:conserved Plasmodium protein, unknown function [Plasmodium yoelii]CDU20730.1 conserved Plasmodium protein, unknown function [Plasmodium yoelii]VTZ81693.1 conserved Plasmodium protein, unknown function [Plasmodium yoelii]|eukprot:XP_022812952.1 conserved Plasmodium protein, unknown function [Plasmodium yoelii]
MNSENSINYLNNIYIEFNLFNNFLKDLEQKVDNTNGDLNYVSVYDNCIEEIYNTHNEYYTWSNIEKNIDGKFMEYFCENVIINIKRFLRTNFICIDEDLKNIKSRNKKLIDKLKGLMENIENQENYIYELEKSIKMEKDKNRNASNLIGKINNLVQDNEQLKNKNEHLEMFLRKQQEENNKTKIELKKMILLDKKYKKNIDIIDDIDKQHNISSTNFKNNTSTLFHQKERKTIQNKPNYIFSFKKKSNYNRCNYLHTLEKNVMFQNNDIQLSQHNNIYFKKRERKKKYMHIINRNNSILSDIKKDKKKKNYREKIYSQYYQNIYSTFDLKNNKATINDYEEYMDAYKTKYHFSDYYNFLKRKKDKIKQCESNLTEINTYNSIDWNSSISDNTTNAANTKKYIMDTHKNINSSTEHSESSYNKNYYMLRDKDCINKNINENLQKEYNYKNENKGLNYFSETYNPYIYKRTLMSFPNKKLLFDIRKKLRINQTHLINSRIKKILHNMIKKKKKKKIKTLLYLQKGDTPINTSSESNQLFAIHTMTIEDFRCTINNFYECIKKDIKIIIENDAKLNLDPFSNYFKRIIKDIHDEKNILKKKKIDKITRKYLRRIDSYRLREKDFFYSIPNTENKNNKKANLSYNKYSSFDLRSILKNNYEEQNFSSDNDEPFSFSFYTKRHKRMVDKLKDLKNNISFFKFYDLIDFPNKQ